MKKLAILIAAVLTVIIVYAAAFANENSQTTLP